MVTCYIDSYILNLQLVKLPFVIPVVVMNSEIVKKTFIADIDMTTLSQIYLCQYLAAHMLDPATTIGTARIRVYISERKRTAGATTDFAHALIRYATPAHRACDNYVTPRPLFT